ncbi:MAG: hypothetical protein KGJ53_15185, partial [Alphaproteobacteria bacterium]|nr:hypothetical protein [Alphaproteobacteria bacterium]
FAGFLVAIITVLGDPALIPGVSWRTTENRRSDIEARLIRHTYLFVFYLIAIALLFIGAIMKNAPDTTVTLIAKLWITRAYLFFGFASFLATFGLPGSLLKLQLARYDAGIDQQRQDAGIQEEEPKPKGGSD